MRTAVFSRSGKPLRVLDTPIPKIVVSEILTLVSYCGICGKDIHGTREGSFMVPPDTILGLEFRERIVDRGSAVRDGEFSQ